MAVARCVTCGATVDAGRADLVPGGVQCATCTALAPPPDVHAGMPRAKWLALAGVVLLVIAALTWVLRIGDVPVGHSYDDDAMPLSIILGVGAAGCFGIAWARWRKR